MRKGKQELSVGRKLKKRKAEKDWKKRKEGKKEIWCRKRDMKGRREMQEGCAERKCWKER